MPLVAGAAIVLLVALQQAPPLVTLAGWGSVGLVTAALLWGNRGRSGVARAGLIALALLELWLGSRALPFTQATAPLAAGLRNAPAALLAATADQPPAGRDRFLSLSDIRYDPGDLAELRALQANRLPPDAIERLVRAAKQVEVIAPNLPLRFRLPAVDGYDGGVLPLESYVKLQGLFLPPEDLIPDGRLREQLKQMPEDRLLDLTGVRFVITDKQRDLWADDVYYDLELPVPLLPGQALALDLTAHPTFPATAVGLVIEQATPGAVSAAAELTALARDGEMIRLPVAVAPHGAEGAPTPVRVQLPRPLALQELATHNTGTGTLILRGLSLLDERTGAHTAITISPRGDLRRIHTGDVKVYHRTAAPGRVWLAHGIEPVADDEAALVRLADPAFDPRAEAVVTSQALASQQPAAAGPDETVSIIAYQAERLEVHIEASAPGMLVVADTFYPGWEATLNGQPTPIWRTNLLSRGVFVEPGEHMVVFTYRPVSWQRGAAVSLSTLALLLISLLVSVFVPGRQRV